MKTLLIGIGVIILVGFGGLVYRNALEYKPQALACPVTYFKCPDGSSITHPLSSCSFPACPPPNVSFSDSNIAFALPDGLVATTSPDAATIAAYALASTTGNIIIRELAIQASSTALATIQQNAVSATSGASVPVTAFTSTVLGGNNFTVVTIERFEGTVDTAYYFKRSSDVLRFDAVDQNVINWTNPSLDVTQLPAESALRKILSTLQGS